MSLQGSIAELQEKLIKLYLDLEHRFKENQLIRDLWSAMAHDVAQQRHSMGLLPRSFWHRLQDGRDIVSEPISGIIMQNVDNEGDKSLRSCFDRALLFEEPATLKIYVPIIRKLRENWTGQALDFYIMVKAHLARIARATQAFAGDPMILRRSSLLLQHFEKEVQEQHVVIMPPARKGQKAQPARRTGKHAAKPQKKAPPRKAPSLTKRAKSHRTRTKPLVKKINIRQRRARR